MLCDSYSMRLQSYDADRQSPALSTCLLSVYAICIRGMKRLLYEREQYGGMICLCLCVSDPTGEVGVGVVDLAPSEYLEVKVQLMFLSQI